MKLKQRKNEKAITLIALVVTIVVLLILASVSISMLAGENGIITQTQKAKLENRGGTVEERVNLWKTEIATTEYSKLDVDTEEQMLQKLIDEELVIEDTELDRDAKTITIGSRVIDYSTIITIYIEGINETLYISYKDGMTWKEFVESSYNDVGMRIDESGEIYYKKRYYILHKDSELFNPENRYISDEKIKKEGRYLFIDCG